MGQTDLAMEGITRSGDADGETAAKTEEAQGGKKMEGVEKASAKEPVSGEEDQLQKESAERCHEGRQEGGTESSQVQKKEEVLGTAASEMEKSAELEETKPDKKADVGDVGMTDTKNLNDEEEQDGKEETEQDSEKDREAKTEKRKKEEKRLAEMNMNIKADAETKESSKKHRMTEAEEDAILLKNEASSPAEFQTTRMTKQPENVMGQMRDYQIEGLNFLIGLYERGLNGILADEMGLGKTLQTISLLAFLRRYKGIQGPHLIIVPKSTLGNWEKELERWCPEISVVRFHGSQEERKALRDTRLGAGKFDVCLTSYEMVTKEKGTLMKFAWRYLIIDEAHRIKNENSILSQMVRIFETQNRLLITGTPLQNNLRELWALLNFLLPDVFSSASDFDSWFSSVESKPGDDEDESKKEMVQQLHTILRPFLIRRLKSDVEKDLPPKKETVLYLRLTPLQEELYRNILKKDVDAINFTGGDRVRLLNILMQLRKCCNHPYLFDGVEDRSLDPFGEHLVEASGKLVFLDNMLARLKSEGNRVLIFSQMTRVLDILEDYCCDRMRGYQYCRIDGTTDGESRDAQIEEFNRPGSEKFIFLLSTRAGGLGINLATADTVILYDSDWNPQADLQAMDRAHRIGQKKPVNVYRLVMEKTLEERILHKAMEKLHLDSLVIQSGRLQESKKSQNKEDLLDMIRYGADSFFKVNTEEVQALDLDLILTRGAKKTEEMNAEIQKSSKNVNPTDFKLAGEESVSMYQYEGVDYTGQKNSGGADRFFLDVGKRTGRGTTADGNYYRENTRSLNVQKPKQRLKPPKEPALNDFQFCNPERLRELYEEEKAIVDDFNARCEEAAREGREEPQTPETILSPEKAQERETLLVNGCPDWLKRDFNMFLRACERHGRHDLDAICVDMKDIKSEEQVRRYARIFWEQGPTQLESWPRIVKAIEEGEAKIARRKDIEKSLMLKVNRYQDAFRELEVPYNGNKGKQFIEEEDRWLICMAHKLGYGRWDELKSEVRRAPDFRFNWFIKSRTPVELKRRLDILVRIVEKENEEIEAAARAAARKKRASLSSTRGKKPAVNAFAKMQSPKADVKKGVAQKAEKKVLTSDPTSSPTRERPASKRGSVGVVKVKPASSPKKAAGGTTVKTTISSPKKTPSAVAVKEKTPASSPRRTPASSPRRSVGALPQKPASSPKKPASSPKKVTPTPKKSTLSTKRKSPASAKKAAQSPKNLGAKAKDEPSSRKKRSGGSIEKFLKPSAKKAKT